MKYANLKRRWSIKRLIAVLIALGIIAAIFIAVSIARSDDKADKLTVSASFYPLYDFAKAVGGDKADVQNITPAGSEPHSFEPSPRQLISALSSQVFIYNGASLEPWVDKILPDYSNVAVKASEGLNLLEDAHNGSNNTGEHEHAGHYDPHFWLDPTLAASMVENISQGFVEADPENSDYYKSQAEDYKNKLIALDQEIKKGLANCKSRTVISSHGALRYYANRYNLEVFSITGLNPDQEPSAAKLAEVSKLAKDKGVTHIFFESLASPKLAETVAREIQAKTAVFDPIEGLSHGDQQAGKDYLSVQQQNLDNLRQALSCQ